MSATKILWGLILTVFMIVLFTTWAATQWTAWKLGFQPQRRLPWFMLGHWAIFVEGAYIAASRGFVTIAMAICMSAWRTRTRCGVSLLGEYDHAYGTQLAKSSRSSNPKSAPTTTPHAGMTPSKLDAL